MIDKIEDKSYIIASVLTHSTLEFEMFLKVPPVVEVVLDRRMLEH